MHSAQGGKAARGIPSHGAHVLDEIKGHVERLDQIATILGVSPKGKVCKAMKGLVEEAAETIADEGDPVIKDLVLIAAAQRVEHYKISGYGSARALAETLKLDEVVDLLQITLDEESTADLILTRLAGQFPPTALGQTANAWTTSLRRKALACITEGSRPRNASGRGGATNAMQNASAAWRSATAAAFRQPQEPD